MGWFQRAIDCGVRRGVEQAFDKAAAPGGLIEQIIWERMGALLPFREPLTQVGFVWALALTFREHGCGFDEAKALANDTLTRFLKDEGIHFGDDSYEWTRATAIDLAQEAEIDHWDA